MQDPDYDPTKTPATEAVAPGSAAAEPVALAPEDIRAHMRQNPAEMKRFIEALLERANVQIPDDYDVESAFADVLAVGAVAHDPQVQGPLARLGYWLFQRLPREGSGG